MQDSGSMYFCIVIFVMQPMFGYDFGTPVSCYKLSWTPKTTVSKFILRCIWFDLSISSSNLNVKEKLRSSSRHISV